MFTIRETVLYIEKLFITRRGVLLRPEANELRTGFADHTQTEEGTEQVQPRDQEVSKQRTDNFKQESQNKNTQGKDENDKRIQRGSNDERQR